MEYIALMDDICYTEIKSTLYSAKVFFYMTNNKVFSASTRDFSDAVKWVAKTSGGQIRLDVAKDDTVLYLSSFHDTKSSRSKIDISLTSGKPGDHTFVVSSGLLVNALKLLKGADFNITVTSSMMVIKSGRTVINLNVIKDSDEIIMPELPALAGHLSISQFRKAISAVSLAASHDDGSTALMSIHCAFSPANKTVSFVATDRYKMMLRTIPFDPIDPTMPDFSMNILASSMKSLVSGLPTNDSSIDIHAVPDGSQFVIRDVQAMSGVGVVASEFVQYKNFLTIPFPHKVKVEVAELKSALEGIATLIPGEEGITLTFNGNECVVSSVHNAGTMVIPVEGFVPPTVEEDEEPELRVAFGPKIIRPCISALSTKFVELHYNAPTKPWVIKELDDVTGEVKDTSFTLLMPIRA